MNSTQLQASELAVPAPMSSKPNVFQRLRDFSKSGQLTTCLIFLPPALLLFTIFVTLPVVEAGYYGFFNWNGYEVSSMAAFTLSHMRFAGRKWIGSYLALGLTFPFATAVLPVFIRVRDFGLLDTYWGVILLQVAFNLGFSVVILQGFFSQLPRELLESAVVDGCSYTRFFWQITLPLSRPVLATVGFWRRSEAG